MPGAPSSFLFPGVPYDLNFASATFLGHLGKIEVVALAESLRNDTG